MRCHGVFRSNWGRPALPDNRRRRCPFYYEEFCGTVRDWVSRKLLVTAHGCGARGPATGLREVYTAHVIPDEMMLLWNDGLAELSHVVAQGTDPTTAPPVMAQRFERFLIGELLKVDSHPTVTRFFTLREAIDRMLTMHLIGMPKNVFRLVSTEPREENRKRLSFVQKFFADPEAPQALRRSSFLWLYSCRAVSKHSRLLPRTRETNL